MKGLSILKISWCNFPCSSIKQLGFILVYVCGKDKSSQIFFEVSGNVLTAIQPFALLDYWNSMNACVLSICAYDNEAWDAVVCLTLRGCVIQFIHFMRPTYLAILICFQGERSNISETTQSKPSFNKSAPCLLCLAFKSSKQAQYGFFSKIVKYIFEQCSVRKGQQASFWNETKQIQERKKTTNQYNKGLCSIPINVMCFNIGRISPKLLAQWVLWNSCICLRNQLLWCRSEASVYFILGFDQCLADNFFQQVTLVAVLFSPLDAVLTEVRCRTHNSPACVKEGVSRGQNECGVCFLLTECCNLVVEVQTRACDLLHRWRGAAGFVFFCV